jgi:hypothetical protein
MRESVTQIEERNLYEILVEKTKERDHLGDPGIHVKTTLK